MRIRANIDGDKAIHRGQKGAWAHRCNAAVLKYNHGPLWIPMAWQRVYGEDMPESTSIYFK